MCPLCGSLVAVALVLGAAAPLETPKLSSSTSFSLCVGSPVPIQPSRTQETTRLRNVEILHVPRARQAHKVDPKLVPGEEVIAVYDQSHIDIFIVDARTWARQPLPRRGRGLATSSSATTPPSAKLAFLGPPKPHESIAAQAFRRDDDNVSSSGARWKATLQTRLLRTNRVSKR